MTLAARRCVPHLTQKLVVRAHIYWREAGASVVAEGWVRRFLAHRWMPRLCREPYHPVGASILDAPVDQSSLRTTPTKFGEGRIHAKPSYAVLRVSWNGASWSKVQLGSPASRYISCIAVDPSNPQRFWLTLSQIGGGMVYRSDNAGSSWVNCTAGLPNVPFNAVVVDPANFKRVWVAADVGVYQTLDLGSSWAAFSNGLPNAMAADLLFHKQDRMLICATRNRGAWVVPVP
jgi:photosystem II stability/assembly factor-like uncharacterized protein